MKFKHKLASIASVLLVLITPIIGTIVPTLGGGTAAALSAADQAFCQKLSGTPFYLGASGSTAPKLTNGSWALNQKDYTRAQNCISQKYCTADTSVTGGYQKFNCPNQTNSPTTSGDNYIPKTPATIHSELQPYITKICGSMTGQQKTDCIAVVANTWDGYANCGTKVSDKSAFDDCVMTALANNWGVTFGAKYPSAPVPASVQAKIDELTAANTPDPNKDNTCDGNGFPLSWLICQGIDLMSKTADTVFQKILAPLLDTQPLRDNDNYIYQAWSNFRIYGNIFLVIALLVIVFGESLGGGLIDAYAARKILPRLLAAGILINISFYLMAIAVDITNVIGGGLQRLIVTPFRLSPDFKIHIGAATSLTEVIGAGGAVWAVGGAAAAALFSGEFLGLFSVFVLLPALFITLGILVVVFLRQTLIIFLAIISPVAFALYCLPNTEKYFRQWWDALFKALLVYPIIAVLFALADVMGVMVTKTTPGILGQLLAVLAFFTPLFLIPFAFKLAGGVLARGLEVAQGMGKRAHEGILGNPNDKNSLRNRTRRNFGERATRAQASEVDAGRKLGARRSNRIRGGIFSRFGDVDARLSRYNMENRETAEAMSATGRDALRYAAAGYEIPQGVAAPDGTIDHNNRRYFNSKGEPISRNLYAEGKRRYGAGAGGIGQSLEYTLRKAQTDENIANMRQAFTQNAIANNWSQDEAVDVWAAATFGHKDKWKSEWYSMPQVNRTGGRTTGVTFQDVDTNTGSYDKMIKEFHTVPEQFKLSSIRPQDWHAMGRTMDTLQSKLDSGATLTPAEAERFVRTDEVLNTMSGRGMVQQNSEGEFVSSGASAETQAVISALFKNRRYATTQLQTGTTPSAYSNTDRVIYDKAAVDSLTKPVAAGGSGISKDAAVVAAAKATARVSGDRSSIPK